MKRKMNYHSFLSKKILRNMLGCLAAGLLMASAAQAEIITSGSINPTDPSTWTSSTTAYIGYTDAGTLSIINGASVTDFWARIGNSSSAEGEVTVDGEGSTWTNASLYVGMYGTGTLSITNGASVTTSGTTIGYYKNGASGTVIVDGVGSTFADSSRLVVGHMGKGALTITNGGTVTDAAAEIGYATGGSGGAVSVDGTGSSWLNSNTLRVGGVVKGTLSVADGGLVTASTVSINSKSSMTIDVKSTLKAGTTPDWTGAIDNDGTVRLVAGAGANTGEYIPMSYGTMTGEGKVQVLGGNWDADAHAVTVSDAVEAQGVGGTFVSLHLASGQRALITDSDTSKSVGAGFLGTGTSTAITLTATSVSGDDLASLESLLAGTDKDILSAWNLSTQGYTVSQDNPVYLSLYAGSATDLLDLAIWHLVNGEWSQYDALDLAFDGTYASFVATSFSGYAVTGTSSVPVPATVWLLGSGLLGMMGLKRRKM